MLKKSLAILTLLLITNYHLPFTAADDPTTPAPSAPAYYNIRSFGATGDGKTLDHAAINKAIDAASAAGGGTVYIGPGKYLCGSIHLQSNIHLLLDMGAQIIGAPQDIDAYDQTEIWTGTAYQDGGHTYFHNSLIWGENLTNVAITGLGTINGGGLKTGDGNQDKIDGFFDWQHNAPADDAANQKGMRLGNKAIALKLCKNVSIKDITIAHGGHFAILATGIDGLTIDNVTIDTNRDGMDLDCCRNTVVSNCRINSPNDDGLCPKSTYALGENRLTENMTITNCQVSGFTEGTLIDGTMKPHKNGTGRIKFGTEASGGFRNITVSNCTFRSCRGLALEEVDGGIMENITISNLTMMDVQSYPIYVTTGKRNRGPNVTGPSIARNILISNVVATGIDPKSGIQITGLPEAPIDGIRLENIRMTFKGGGSAEQGATTPRELAAGYPEPGGPMPGYALFARHVKDLEMANIHFSYENQDQRPAIVCIDIDGLEMDNIKAQTADGVKVARFEAVQNDLLRNSPALEADGAIDRKAEASQPTPTAAKPKKAKAPATPTETSPAATQP